MVEILGTAPGLIPDPILWMIAHTPHSVGSGISGEFNMLEILDLIFYSP